MGRFKQLVIREGRECKTREKQIGKRNNSATLGQGLGSPSRNTYSNIFELFCRYWNPHQMEEVNCSWRNAVHKQVDPRPFGTRRLMLWISTYFTVNQSEGCPWANHTLFELLLWNASLSRLGHSFEGISLLWPMLPGKATKLFFSVSIGSPTVSDSFATPWAVACQAPLSMGFPRQEYWSG